MSDLGELFESTLRKVFQEELKAVVEAQDDRLLTVEQAAEILGYTDVDSVRRLAREGHLEVVRLGEKTRRYRHSDVQRLVREGIV